MVSLPSDAAVSRKNMQRSKERCMTGIVGVDSGVCGVAEVLDATKKKVPEPSLAREPTSNQRDVAPITTT